MLTNAHTAGKLSLSLPLGSFLLPVVKALRYQESLWDLDLSLSKLDDHVFQVQPAQKCLQIAIFKNNFLLISRVFVKPFQRYLTW